MQILNDIIDGAASTDVRLAVLLRKSLILASRLNNVTWKDWSSAELDGYPDIDNLPPYRVFSCQSIGLLLGPLGAQISRQPIPLAILKKHHREAVQEVRIPSGVAELEATIEGAETKILMSPWAPDMTMMYQDKIIEGYSLNRAWREFPLSRLVGICDTVRNRLLRLALELREQVGEADDPLSQITPAQLESKVVNYIYGGQNIIGSSVGRDITQLSNSGVVRGNFNSLTSVLSKHGVAEEDIEALPDAIAMDESAIKEGHIGAGIHGWLQRVKKGAVATSKAVSVEVIAGAIRSYLGL